MMTAHNKSNAHLPNNKVLCDNATPAEITMLHEGFSSGGPGGGVPFLKLFGN